MNQTTRTIVLILVLAAIGGSIYILESMKAVPVDDQDVVEIVPSRENENNAEMRLGLCRVCW